MFGQQLAQTPTGLPVEIYVFTNETEWLHEDIQAELFEYLYASLHQFELKTYQHLGGADLNHSLLSSSEPFLAWFEGACLQCF